MKRQGFTLIEVITAIAVIAIIMIPLALMAMEYVRSIAYADSLTMTANLARREMAIVNNLDYNTLASGSFPNYMGFDYDLTRQVDFVLSFGNAVKKVIISVVPHAPTEGLTEFATYAMNVAFGAGGGRRASFFSASGGSFTSWTTLSGMTLQNSSATEAITMVGVIMTSNPTMTLSTITMNGIARYSGLETLTTTQKQILFQDNFVMSANTSYAGAQGAAFTFTGANRSYTVGIVFLFSDGSQSGIYTRSYKKPKR